MWTPLIALMKTYFEHTLCYRTHSSDEEAKVGEAFIDFIEYHSGSGPPRVSHLDLTISGLCGFENFQS